MADASTRAVGYVVGEVRTDEFTFVSSTELAPPRLEYLVLRGVQEQVGSDAGTRAVDVLAQVATLAVSNRLLSTSMNYHEVEAILRRLGAAPPVVIGTAKVLGYLDPQGQVRVPRGAARPGDTVETAPDELLERFFNKDVRDGMEIGSLINRPAVPVTLNPDGLNRHLAVIAQTGAGKSYTVGVLLERLLELGGTVVVFDPNSDYVLMRRDAERRPTPFADRVSIYRMPVEQQHRISDSEVGGSRRLSVRFSNLDIEEVCEMAGIAEGWANLRAGMTAAFRRLHGDYTAEDLVAALEEIGDYEGWEEAAGASPPWQVLPGGANGGRGGAEGEYADDDSSADAFGSDGEPHDADDLPDTLDTTAWFGDAAERAARRERADRARGADVGKAPKPPSRDEVSGARKALKYAKYLAGLPVWGHDDIPLDDLLRPMHLSTLDMAGVDRRIVDFVATKVQREVWQEATRHGMRRPVFLVLEEAHNFVGRESQGRAGYWIKRIAAEGRKFGVFLMLITQRPGKVHADTLSQCGSQIIMRLTNPDDQSAVRRASESVSESLLLDLPGLNIGEAVVMGPLVRVPVMVRVTGRRSAEGGSDYKIAEALQAARGERVTETMVAEDELARKRRGRSAWQEEI